MCGASIHARTPTSSPWSRSPDLLSRLPPESPPPLFVFDAGYDSAQLTQGVEELPVAVLVRLRGDRCFYADPPPAVPSPKGGRPRRHGAKFACKDPATWPAPSAEHVTEDEQYGTVRVRAWAGLHPKQQAHPGRGTRKTRPIVRGTVVLVEVNRLPARPYPPQMLWLWWAGRWHTGSGPAVAILRSPLRPGAHAAFPQTEPGLDDAPRPASRASRSLDLARGGRLHAVATRAAVGGGSPSALGAPPGFG